MTFTMSTFDRVTNRIRKFLFPVLRPNRSSRRRVESASTREISKGFLTLDLPLKSLGDEICWDAIKSGLEATRMEGRSDQVLSTGRPFSMINLPERRPEDELCWEILLQDVFEALPPFFVIASVPKPDKPKPVGAFHFFVDLPFELRLKIWHLTVQPRLVHWNIIGAKYSWLKIDRKLPVILQVCQESRREGLCIFDINPKATRPFFFNPKADTLLWTRYPNCPRTVEQDAAKLLKSPILGNVRHLAILLKYWNMLISQESPKEVYTAIRKAPMLEVLTLVDDYFVRRPGYSQLTYGREMKLLDICPEKNGARTVRWERELRVKGKEKLWKKWDVNLTDREGLPRWKFPEIKFARVVVEMP